MLRAAGIGGERPTFEDPGAVAVPDALPQVVSERDADREVMREGSLLRSQEMLAALQREPQAPTPKPEPVPVRERLNQMARNVGAGAAETGGSIIESLPALFATIGRAVPQHAGAPPSRAAIEDPTGDLEARRAEQERALTELLMGRSPLAPLAQQVSELAPETDPALRDDFTIKVSRALGSTLPFFVAALGGPLGVGTAGASAGLGELTDDARAHGVTEGTEIADASGLAALGGMSEVLPVERALNRVGGFVGPYAGQVLMGVLEEFGQEVFQQFVQNVAAGQSYDPDRGLLEGTGEAGATGGTVGGIMSALMAAAGLRTRGGSIIPSAEAMQGAVDEAFAPGQRDGAPDAPAAESTPPAPAAEPTEREIAAEVIRRAREHERETGETSFVDPVFWGITERLPSQRRWLREANPELWAAAEADLRHERGLAPEGAQETRAPEPTPATTAEGIAAEAASEAAEPASPAEAARQRYEQATAEAEAWPGHVDPDDARVRPVPDDWQPSREEVAALLPQGIEPETLSASEQAEARERVWRRRETAGIQEEAERRGRARADALREMQAHHETEPREVSRTQVAFKPSGTTVEVTGTRVDVPDFDVAETAVVRAAGEGGGHVWRVYELRTGTVLGWSTRSRKDAIESASRRVDDAGGPEAYARQWAEHDAILQASTVPAAAEADPESEYGARNRVVTRARAEEVRTELQRRLGNLNVGLDPETLRLSAELAVFHVEAGARTFADFSRRMIEDFGEAIRPHLRDLYERVRGLPGMDADGFDPPDVVARLTGTTPPVASGDGVAASGAAMGDGAAPPTPPPTIPSTEPALDPFSWYPERLQAVQEGREQGDEGALAAGRPALANPGAGESVRTAIDVADQMRAEAGTPETRTMEEVRRQARERLDADYEGEKARLFSGDGITSDVDVVMAREVINREGLKALASGDREAIKGLARMVDGYRSQRTETARALSAGRDETMSPVERARAHLVEAVLTPPEHVRKKLEKAKETDAWATATRMRAQEAAERAAAEAEKKAAAAERREAEAARRRAEKRAAAARERTAEARRALLKAEAELVESQAELGRARAALKKAQAQARNARASTERAARKTADRVLDAHAARIEKIRKGLEKHGLDPSSMSDADLLDRRKLAHAIRLAQAGHAAWGDMVYEYWINSILSAPTTQGANIIGNTANAAWEFTVQRWVEAVLNEVMPGTARGGARLGELRYLYRGLSGATLRSALRRMWLAFDTEAPIFADEMGYAGVTKFEAGQYAKAIDGKTGRVVRLPGRLLVAADEMFKSVFWSMQVGAEAFRIAKAEGLKGEALAARIDELVSDPQSPAGVAAFEKARELTFQEDPGPIASAILKFRNTEGPVGTAARYVVPFVTTPSNVLKAGLRKSPLGSIGLLHKVARQGLYSLRMTDDASFVYRRHAFARDFAEQVIAWAVMGGVLSLVLGQDDDEPLITGTGADYSEQGKYQLQQRAVPPTSIRLGGTYYRYDRIEPLGTSLALMVNAAEAVKQAENGKALDAAMAEFGKQSLGVARDKSFLLGFGDIIRAIEEPEHGLPRWAANFATSWVPNVIRSGARSGDPYFRDYGGSLEDLPRRTMQRALPFEAMAPPPKVDLWGRPMEKAGTDGADGASAGERPFSSVLYDVLMPVWRQETSRATALDRLILNWNARNPEGSERYRGGFYPALPSRSFTLDGTRITMSPEAYHEFLRRSGSRAYENLLEDVDAGRLNVDDPMEDDLRDVEEELRLSRQEVKEEMWEEGWFEIDNTPTNPPAPHPSQ